jgi:hypothetical protein
MELVSGSKMACTTGYNWRLDAVICMPSSQVFARTVRSAIKSGKGLRLLVTAGLGAEWLQELSPYSSGGYGAAQALEEAGPDVIISTISAFDVEERKFGNLLYSQFSKKLGNQFHECQRC